METKFTLIWYSTAYCRSTGNCSIKPFSSYEEMVKFGNSIGMDEENLTVVDENKLIYYYDENKKQAFEKKITIKEFWESYWNTIGSSRKLAIHCKTYQEAQHLIIASRKIGIRYPKIEDISFSEISTKVCYCNDSGFGRIGEYQTAGIKVLEFEEIDFDC